MGLNQCLVCIGNAGKSKQRCRNEQNGLADGLFGCLYRSKDAHKHGFSQEQSQSMGPEQKRQAKGFKVDMRSHRIDAAA